MDCYTFFAEFKHIFASIKLACHKKLKIRKNGLNNNIKIKHDKMNKKNYIYFQISQFAAFLFKIKKSISLLSSLMAYNKRNLIIHSHKTHI